MQIKYTYIFHCKNIRTPLIWALFDEIERDYGYFIYFLKYKENYDYYSGFSGKETNYKDLPTYIWNKVVEKIQCILDKHNMQAYDNDYCHYIEMTNSSKLYRLYNI
tara:strand:- start:254 stop:571 length:318 start_codon:yes stop_codon:yes gene_type:complete